MKGRRWRSASQSRALATPDARRAGAGTNLVPVGVDATSGIAYTGAMPNVHEFQPTKYHVAIGPWKPVLRIDPGDTVITRTIDSGGLDHLGNKAHVSGNPQTGPFFIKGANPGDVLAVRFDRVVPNRPWGRTSGRLAGNVVDPEFIASLPSERGRATWHVDVERWEASLESHAPEEEGIPAFRIPLDPMVGCFGVAPDRGQTISCATSGPHGGNMDYRGFRQGVTVFLPVFVPGALFHLGDGHATQGCGEINGTGIEISMDITFTAWIHRRAQPIRWPRADDGTWLMAAGNARPLDQALQHATTELTRWLDEDYGLNARASSILLGQSIRYDVGNVFDPAFTMVAKVEKALIERFAPKRPA